MTLAPLAGFAAPYAALVMDARTGEVLYETNARTRLHPASLTKMMTLYIAFEAIDRGEISLDTLVTITKHAANEPPSKLGLRPGQKIALRYLIRAAAIKSANDAATAIGEAISGSEEAFAKRMNRTARALGMTDTTFRNAHGLTREGHMSTAYDMTILGRRLFYDHPKYYNIFSRRSANAGMAEVASTNRRFLDSYAGADGIKTGYTNAAGFNLVASAERGNKRILATVFGGTSTAARNAKVAELLDLGFGKAPGNAKVRKPAAPAYGPNVEMAEAAPDLGELEGEGRGRAAGKTIRVTGAVTASTRPRPRPGTAPAEQVPADDALLLAMQDDIQSVLAEVNDAAPAAEAALPFALVDATAAPPAAEAPDEAALAAALAAVGPAPAELPAESPPDVPATGADLPAPDLALAGVSPKQRPAGLIVARAEETVVAAAPLAEPVVAPEAAPATEMATLQPEARPEARPAPALEPEPAAAVLPADLPFQLVSGPPPGSVPAVDPEPAPRPAMVLASVAPRQDVAQEPEVVTRLSTSDGRVWGITLGKFNSRAEAEKLLMRTALAESTTLADSLRKVVPRKTGFEASFVGMSQDQADLACRRLLARGTQCFTLGP